MPILVFCDESGDTGFPVKKGTAPTYVASTVFVNSAKVESLRAAIKLHKRSILNLRHPAEWKHLTSKDKRDDSRIAEYLNAVMSGGGAILGSTIVDKRRTVGRGLSDPQTQTLTPYAHGLVFKQTLPYIATFKVAEFYMDRNSSIETQDNLRKYLSTHIPAELRLKTTIAAPKFISPKEDYLLQFADFVAGLTRVMFDNYSDALEDAMQEWQLDLRQLPPHQIPGFIYPKSYVALTALYSRRLPRWDWNSLLYHPYQFRGEVAGFFPSLPPLSEAK